MCNRACNHAVAKSQIILDHAKREGLTVVNIQLGERAPEPPKPLPEQVMYRPFFDLVVSQDNWKMPVDAKIDAPSGKADRELFKLMITRAVTFFAGCCPIIVDLGDKQIGVKAVGYYEAVGA